MHRIATTCSLLLAGCVGVTAPVLTEDEPAAETGWPAHSLAAGEFHSCALDRDDRPRCWGGVSADVWEYVSVATEVPSGTFVKLSASGDDYTCGLRSDGSIACAGWIYDPEDPDHDLRPPLGRYLDIATAWPFACALRLDRTVECWGQRPGSLAVPSGTFVQLSGRLWDVCGVRDDGTIACWGYRPADQTVAPPTGSFATVQTGAALHCALDRGGAVTCWKSWIQSELGVSPPADRFSSIAVGSTSACGIRLDGTIACWGVPPVDWWGNGIAGPPEGRFTAITAGTGHMCAIRVDGGVSCWGVNYVDQATPP